MGVDIRLWDEEWRGRRVLINKEREQLCAHGTKQGYFVVFLVESDDGSLFMDEETKSQRGDREYSEAC